MSTLIAASPLPRLRKPLRARLRHALHDELPLIYAAQNGCRKSFADLVTDANKRMLAVAAKTLGGKRERACTPEDVVQDALVVAWRKLPQYVPQAKFATWLCEIARRTAKKRRGQTKKHASLSGKHEEVAHPGATPEVVATAKSCHAEVTAARESMTPLEAALHRLLVDEGNSPSSICELTGLGAREVKTILESARRKLSKSDEETERGES